MTLAGKTVDGIDVVQNVHDSVALRKSSSRSSSCFGKSVSAMIVSIDVKTLSVQESGKPRIAQGMFTDAVTDLDDGVRMPLGRGKPHRKFCPCRACNRFYVLECHSLPPVAVEVVAHE